MKYVGCPATRKNIVAFNSELGGLALSDGTYNNLGSLPLRCIRTQLNCPKRQD